MSPEIAELRATSNRARRAYVRCRRRNGLNPVLERQLWAAYRQLKKELQKAINCAKQRAREELLMGLNREPWGRPYRGLRGKLRTQGAPVTETLPPDLLLRLVGELFPHPGEHAPPNMAPRIVTVDNVAPPHITEQEMGMTLDRLRARTTAPGPDDVPGRVLRDALKHLGGRLRELFDECLSNG
nr:uncharacterized protein LOC113401710 [Vanessa tameamea]